MNRYKCHIFCVLLAGMLAVSVPYAEAQKGQKQQKAPKILYSGKVTDAGGTPVVNATVMSGEGSVTVYTGRDGEFSIMSTQGGTLLIEALGYEDRALRADEGLPEVIILNESGLFNSEHDMIERVDLGHTSRRDLVGAISTVNMENLKKYPDLSIANGLQGRAAGLVVRPTTNGLGMNTPDLYIRGQHTTGSNQAKVIIDGIERSMDDIIPEEIESIRILKDPLSKVTYGPAAANGVVMITTKRGEAYKRVIRTTVEAGVSVTGRTPEYLGAYDYARYYNQARTNDGLPEFYSAQDLEGYRNSGGMNDFRYPDADYYNEMLRRFTSYRKAALEFYGGNQSVKYSMTIGYTGGSGLEDVGKRQDLNRFSVRGNLDIRLNSFISVQAGMAGRLEVKDWGAVSSASMFPTIRQLKPNEYPVFMSGGDIDKVDGEDGIPYMGASNRYASNVYADMMYGGSDSERYSTSQTDLGINFNLNRFVEGLQANAYITFDNYNYVRQTLTREYPTYSREFYTDENGDLQVRVQQRRNINVSSDDYSINSATVKRTLGWRFNVAYERQWNRHRFSAVASVKYYKDEQKGSTQNDVDMVNSVRANYSYDDRFLFEAAIAVMGSNRFGSDNRFYTSPVVGAGWIVSNEDFLAGSRGIDFLKLKASYGILGYSRNTDFNLYKTARYQNGTISFGENNNVKRKYMVTLIRNGARGLKWESSREVNVGLEGLFLGKRLSAEVNYFNEMRRDIIGTRTTATASTLGNYTVVSNMGKVRNQGVDAYAAWSGQPSRDFSYTLGVTFLYSKNKQIEGNENPSIEEYRKSIGKPTSTVFGLDATGLFGKDVTLNGHPIQTYGYYQNGDIAYADLNNDGVVDGRDLTALGQNFPQTVWGIDMDFNWRGWGVYAMFTAETGVGKVMSNSYFWNYGEDNYSRLVFDSYHETENPAGVYPRLTTTNGDNNYRTSSFWFERTDFLRLKNAELSYTFSNPTRDSFFRTLKIFVRGTNLFVISPFKDLDPELPSSGVTNYPAYSTYTGGVTITF